MLGLVGFKCLFFNFKLLVSRFDVLGGRVGFVWIDSSGLVRKTGREKIAHNKRDSSSVRSGFMHREGILKRVSFLTVRLLIHKTKGAYY